MSPHSDSHRRRWPWIVVGIVVLALVVAAGWRASTSRKDGAQAARRSTVVTVVTARAEKRDVPVRILANGTVTALQSVDLRAQITSTVREIHIREGQNVGKGELLFSFDSRAEEANIRKAEAQVEKDRADLATAKRNLERQRELFTQKFISQAALDTAQNQVDTLSGQLAVDSAAVESARVARAYTEIRAPFAGRTGAIVVREGSLVQPTSATSSIASPPLVTITQVDPVSVSFTIPEKELPGLQKALRQGPVTATARPQGGEQVFKGKVTFVDNTVDAATGTIRVKAEFANPDARLWPGMYANVEIAPRVIEGATVVPAQAVQTGPDNRFVYVVGDDRKVTQRNVTLAYVEERFAAVSGIDPGTRVVVEGAQNVRPGVAVAEAADRSMPGAAQPETARREGRKTKSGGET